MKGSVSRFRVLLLVTAFTCLAHPAEAQKKKSGKATGITLEGWGTTVNVPRDTKATLNDGALTITVPGTPRNLNKVISDLSAPRVLQEVEGDFSIQVKVSGDFNPSPISTVAPRGKAYNGAGLLLWENEDRFVRLERNIWMNSPSDAACHPPLFEVMINGAPTGTSPAPVPATFFSTPATWFRMVRTGNTINAFLSHDGAEWVPAGTTSLFLPAKLQVGVAAVNTSKKPFTAVFQELKLDQQ